MVNRNLDGVYFRVKRDGIWDNVCFSDLTEMEQDEVMKDWNIDQIKRLAKLEAEALRKVGDEFSIYCE